MPPHRGHCQLIDFAANFADTVTVVVGSLEAEPIPGGLRVEWMRRLFPALDVVHLTDENPQYPEEHPDFWEIWKSSLQRVCPHKIDYLFASEAYGEKLAEVLGAEFVPNNAMRDLLPVSGTAIREEPHKHWEYLPDPVKPYFTHKVLVFGPESTGKTTLCQDLATHFRGLWVPEYARTWLRERADDEITLADMEMIARGQQASEESLLRAGATRLFCDTDPLTTALWCEELFDQVPESVAKLAQQGSYRLTLLLQPDVPWEAGHLRLKPQGRDVFFRRCREALEVSQRDYVIIEGENWIQRFEQAVQAVEALSS